MAYIVDPSNPNEPINSRGATQGAEELRALKGLLQTLIGGGVAFPISSLKKNAILGGDFDTNPWQRGVNFVGIANNAYSADRWKYLKVGTMIEDATQTVDAPFIGAALKNRTMDVFAQNCFQLNVTTAEAVLGAGDYSRESQYIEGYNFKLFARVPLVLSFWHKHTKVGTYCVAFRNAGAAPPVADRSYIAEYTQAVSDVWEFEAIAIPASPAAGTWNYTNGTGLEVSFCRGSGATFQTPPNVWTIGNFLASANQVNSLDVIGNKFRIDLVQLELGTISTKFERRSIQEELLLCQRYFWKTFDQGVTPAQNIGLGVGSGSLISYFASIAGATQNGLHVSFTVPMRVAPAAPITYNPSAANAKWRNITLGADSGVTGISNTIGNRGFMLQNPQVAGDLAGNLISVHATADAEL